MRHIIVGDVHGCIDELEAVVVAASYAKGDQIVLVGDLVAKGPDSAGVIDFAREHNALAVRGNHDEYAILWRHSLEAGREPPKVGKGAGRVAADLTEAQFRWLEACPYHLTVDATTVVVHAGLAPDVPLAKQQVDHMLKLRSIRLDGTYSERAHEGVPWASAWKGPEHVFFGHDAIRGLQEWPMATGLDTGCVYGRRLTAYVLEEKRFVSVEARKVYSEIRAKDG